MTVQAGTSGGLPPAMAPVHSCPPTLHNMYPYPTSGGTSTSASYYHHHPAPPSYPTPPASAQPPRSRGGPSSSACYSGVSDPSWSSHRPGQQLAEGVRATAEFGRQEHHHHRRLSVEPSQPPPGAPSPFLRVNTNDLLLPYEVPPPYPTPSFDRRYYPSSNSSSPIEHLVVPSHPPTQQQWQQRQLQRPQCYLPPSYVHEAPPPPSYPHPFAASATPLHPPSYPPVEQHAGGAHRHHHGGYYSNVHPVLQRYPSLEPPLPSPPTVSVASATTGGAAQLQSVPHQVTTQKRKTKGATASLLLALDKSPTTMSFERILECATLIASGPRRTPTTPAETSAVGGGLLRAEDATNLAHRLAVAGEEEELDGNRHRHGGRSNENLVPAAVRMASTVPLQDRTNPTMSLVPSPVLPASKLVAGDPFAEIAHDPDLHKQVVLQMALQKQLYDEPRIRDFTVSPLIGPGFFWRDYPPMEQVLYENMVDYYDVSSGRRQSKLQQSFTARLADKVRYVAAENGWTFGPELGEKVLRDRIRCFYKTHLQNAKKRLVTLQKHPESPDHRRTLRVFVRSVRLGISVEESERHEPQPRTKPSSVLARPSSVGSSDGRPPVRGEIFTTLQKTHQSASTKGAMTVSPRAVGGGNDEGENAHNSPA